MDLCNDDHEEVCYDGHRCPVCAQIETIKTLEDEIESLQSRIDELTPI